MLLLPKVWPYEGKDKVDLLVPPQEGNKPSYLVSGKESFYCQCRLVRRPLITVTIQVLIKRIIY